MLVGLFQTLNPQLQALKADADKEKASAQYAFGMHCFCGKDITEDQPKGIKYLELAAKQNHHLAQFFLAYVYNLKGSKFYDASKALELYKLSKLSVEELAKKGDREAQFLVAVNNFDGVKKSSLKWETKLKWYKKAALQGHYYAAYNLGRWGKEKPYKDLEEAVFWLRISADNGYYRAWEELGHCYEHGLGVMKDLGHAHYWYQKAHDSNNMGEWYKFQFKELKKQKYAIPKAPHAAPICSKKYIEDLNVDDAEHKSNTDSLQVQQIQRTKEKRQAPDETFRLEISDEAKKAETTPKIKTKPKQRTATKPTSVDAAPISQSSSTEILDPKLLEKLNDLPENLQGRLESVESKTQLLSTKVLKVLNENDATLLELILNSKEESLLHQEILKNDVDLRYYSMLSVLLSGTQHACEGIFSGFEANAKKFTSDYAASAFDAMSNIPLIGMAAKLISVILKGKNFKAKNDQIKNLVFFFVTFKKPEEFLRQLARLSALGHRERNYELATAQPTGVIEKAKHEARVLQDKLLANANSDPVMLEGRRHYELIIVEIMQGNLGTSPSHERMLHVIVGQEKTKIALEMASKLREQPDKLTIETTSETEAESKMVISNTAHLSDPFPRSSTHAQITTLLSKVSLLEQSNRTMQEELEAQKAKIKQQAAKLDASEQTAVAGNGNSVQALLSPHAAASPLGQLQVASELASLDQKFVQLSQSVAQHDDYIRQKEREADKTALNNRKASIKPLKPQKSTVTTAPQIRNGL